MADTERNSAKKPSIPVKHRSRPGKKVLVVEDDEFSFEFLRLALRNRDLEIIHARNGEEALDIFSETDGIDLILLDLQLPLLNGYDVCKKIREKDRHIPIIVQTAHTMADDKIKCEAAGCSGFLSKPINLNKLLELVDRFLA